MNDALHGNSRHNQLPINNGVFCYIIYLVLLKVHEVMRGHAYMYTSERTYARVCVCVCVCLFICLNAGVHVTVKYCDGGKGREKRHHQAGKVTQSAVKGWCFF